MKKNLLGVILIGILLVISIIGFIVYYLESHHKSFLVYGLESASVKVIHYTSFQ